MAEQVIQERDGYVVTLGERNFTFKVCGDGRYLRDFPSFKEADEWITGELRAAAKGDRIKIALEAVKPDGARTMILGLNMNTGKLKTDLDPSYNSELYAYTPKVQRLVRELHEAQQKVSTLSELLHRTKINHSSYGRLESANYNAYVKSLLTTFKKAQEAALDLDKQERQGVPETKG